MYHVSVYLYTSKYLWIIEKTVLQDLCVLIAEGINILLLEENVNKWVSYFLISNSIIAHWRQLYNTFAHWSYREGARLKGEGMEWDLSVNIEQYQETWYQVSLWYN